MQVGLIKCKGMYAMRADFVLVERLNILVGNLFPFGKQ